MIAAPVPNRRVRVMHLVDTLEIGGRERIVVSLANRMPRGRFAMQICTTRRDGPLLSDVGPHVEHLCLARRRRFDTRAVRTLVEFIRRSRTDILHAHGTAVFAAYIASLFPPHPAIVWHDHFGTNERRERPAWLYRRLMHRVSTVLAVSEPLATWSRDRLGLPAPRVRCFPNFVDPSDGADVPPELPGRAGSRIVCVANLRPAKDHLNLLRAMRAVVDRMPAAHLLLVGTASDAAYCENVRRTIGGLGLRDHVSLLGQRSDVAGLLRACDVGVLSSASEGLPVSLLEYGAAGLPAVATDVGQCAAVLDHGRAGLLVPPGQSRPLAEALLSLLQCQAKRSTFAAAFRQRVAQDYSAGAVVAQLCEVYDHVLDGRWRQ